MGDREKVEYGSLEDEIDREQGESEWLSEARRRGHVNVSSTSAETLELARASLEEQERHAEKIQELVAKKRERTITVPTDDDAVKAQLRALGFPICLFGERPAERRERLRKALARLAVESDELEALENRLEEATQEFKRLKTGQDISISAQQDKSKEEQGGDRKEVFYTPAKDELIAARKEIATVSWQRAKERLAKQKALFSDVDALVTREDAILEEQERMKLLTISASQVGDKRPLACCGFSSQTPFLATGSFSGAATVWDYNNFRAVASLNGHEDRCVSLDFNPVHPLHIATASADCTLKIWHVTEDLLTVSDDMQVEEPVTEEQERGAGNEEEKKEKTTTPSVPAVRTLEGHAMRASKVTWHSFGKLVGSSSYDHTWRLWDAETGTQLLLQEGHEYPVYGLALNHPDGSLCFSGDLAGIGRLWDMRSGKAIHSLMGHAKGILCADFSVNGYHIATGSLDHTARIWDIRQRKTLHVIPGHNSLISKVRFTPALGATLVTSSYDNTCKIWSTREALPVNTLSGHSHLVMDMDISPDGSTLLTSSYDRTWKLWGISDFTL